MFFSPFLKAITAFHIAFWRWYCNGRQTPGCLSLPPRHRLSGWKHLPLCRSSSPSSMTGGLTHREACRGMWVTTRQAQGQCVKQYTHANTLPLILPKLIKIVNRCTFTQTSAEFWGAPSELDILFLAFVSCFPVKYLNILKPRYIYTGRKLTCLVFREGFA